MRQVGKYKGKVRVRRNGRGYLIERNDGSVAAVVRPDPVVMKWSMSKGGTHE